MNHFFIQTKVIMWVCFHLLIENLFFFFFLTHNTHIGAGSYRSLLYWCLGLSCGIFRFCENDQGLNVTDIETEALWCNYDHSCQQVFVTAFHHVCKYVCNALLCKKWHIFVKSVVLYMPGLSKWSPDELQFLFWAASWLRLWEVSECNLHPNCSALLLTPVESCQQDCLPPSSYFILCEITFSSNFLILV